jgi:hypothetical protein
MIVNKKVSSFVHTKSTKFATRGGAEAARVAHNHKVAGSSPAPATKIRRPLDEGFLFWHLVHDSEPSRTAGGSNSVKFPICTEFS